MLVSITGDFDWGISFVDVYNFGYTWDVGKNTWWRNPDEKILDVLSMIDEYLGSMLGGEGVYWGRIKGMFRAIFGWNYLSIVSGDVVEELLRKARGSINSLPSRAQETADNIIRRIEGYIKDGHHEDLCPHFAYILSWIIASVRFYEKSVKNEGFVDILRGYVAEFLRYRAGENIGIARVVEAVSLLSPIFKNDHLEKVLGFKKTAFKNEEIADSEFSCVLTSDHGYVVEGFYARINPNRITLFVRNYVAHFVIDLIVDFDGRKIVVPATIEASRNWYSGEKEIETKYGLEIGIRAGDYKLGTINILIPLYPNPIWIGDGGELKINAGVFGGYREYAREAYRGVKLGTKYLADILEEMYECGLIDVRDSKLSGRPDRNYWRKVAENLINRISSNTLSTSESAAISGMIFWFEQLGKFITGNNREERRKSFESLLDGVRHRSQQVAAELCKLLSAYIQAAIDAKELIGRFQIDRVRSILGEFCDGNIQDTWELLLETGELFIKFVGDAESIIREYGEENVYSGWLSRARGFYGEFVEKLADMKASRPNEVSYGDLDYCGVLMGESIHAYGQILSRMLNDESLPSDLRRNIESLLAIRVFLTLLRNFAKYLFLLRDSISEYTGDIESICNIINAFTRFILIAWRGIRKRGCTYSLVSEYAEAINAISERYGEGLASFLRDKYLDIAIKADMTSKRKLQVGGKSISLESIIESIKKRLGRESRRFMDFARDMQVVFGLQRVGFVLVGSLFHGKLLLDAIVDLSARSGFTATERKHRLKYMHKIMASMPDYMRLFVLDLVRNDLVRISYSIFLKLVGILRNDPKIRVSPEVIEELVDSMTDYKVSFLLEIMYDRPGNPLNTNLPSSMLREILKQRILEEYDGRKLTVFITKGFIRSLGLLKRITARDLKERLGEIEEKFVDIYEATINEVIDGVKLHEPRILKIFEIINNPNTKIDTFSPTLFRNAVGRFAMTLKTDPIHSISDLSRAIAMSILADSPIGYEEMRVLATIINAFGYAQSGDIDSLISALEASKEGRGVYAAMDIERLIDRLQTYKNTLGAQKMNSLIGTLLETLSCIRQMLEEFSESNIAETRSKIGDIIEKINVIAELLSGGRHRGARTILCDVSKEGGCMILRIAGWTMVMMERDLVALPYAVYVDRAENGKISSIRLRGDIYGLAKILMMLYRDLKTIMEVANSEKILKASSFVAPTYPQLHFGVELTKYPTGLRIKDEKRFLSYFMMLLASTETEWTNPLRSAMMSIADGLKRGDAEIINKGVEKLDGVIADVDKEIGNGRTEFWLLKNILVGIRDKISYVKNNMDKIGDETKTNIAKNVKKVGESIERAVRIIRSTTAQMLIQPIKGGDKDPERLSAEYLDGVLSLILEDMRLAPGLKQQIMRELEEEEEEKGRLRIIGEKMGRFLSRIGLTIATFIAIIMQKISPLAKITGTESTAMAMALWLTFGPMAPIITRMFSRIGRKLGKHTENLVGNLINGMIVAIMTTLGMLAMNLLLVATAPKERVEVLGETIEIPNPWRSPLRNIITFEAPAIIWIIAATVIAIVASGIIGKLRKPDKIVSMLLGEDGVNEPEPRAKKIIMKAGLIVALIMGLATYMKTWGIGIFDYMPSGVLLSAVAWVWDEVDDLGDGAERIESWRTNTDKVMKDSGGIAEIVVLPFLLGAFAALCGIVDPWQLIIPGSNGFVDYVCGGWLPDPWGTIIGALIKIVFFVVGMLIACGSGGLGAVMYIVGSVMGQIILMRLLSAASKIVVA